MVEKISVVISAITLIILLINQYKLMKDNEPQLSFSLRSINNVLYLNVKNNGKTKAKSVRIIINKMYNNSENGIQEDQIFQIPFELASQEEILGIVGYIGETISNHVFPYIDIEVIYDKPHFIKRVKYERQVFYYASTEKRVFVDTGWDLNSINEDLNNKHKSTLRLANYFDGNEVAPFDELSIVSENHFQKDLKNTIDGNISKINNREEVIKNSIKK